MWYEDRAFQLLRFSMSQEVKKGPFAALTMESSKNFILTHLQKIVWFYLSATKDNLLGKVWGKTLFPCEMPWIALRETLSITSRFKLEILKKIFPSRNFFRKFWSRACCTCNEPPRRIKHACTKHKINEILIKSNTIRHYVFNVILRSWVKIWFRLIRFHSFKIQAFTFALRLKLVPS